MQHVLDISFWNGTCDFQKIKAAGYNYIILRAGYGTTKDSKFDEYAKGCKAAGIKIGIYWFAYPTSKGSAVAEAKKCLEVIAPYDIDLPVFYDYEYDSLAKAQNKGYTHTADDVNAFTIDFCEEIKKAGYTAGYYTNTNYYQTMYKDIVKNKGYVFWLAAYRSDRAYYTPTLKCDFFQYSDLGKVPGNGGDRCDMDVCYSEQYLNCRNIKKEELKVEAVAPTATVSDYSKYIHASGIHYISNSGSDENGGSHGGAAGDQTGNEWVIRTWYDRKNWDCVLRYAGPNKGKVGMKLAELGCMAALNNNIGYDQYQRDTYWNELQKVGFDPRKIAVKCESDCSAGVIANTKAVGHLFGIDALKNIKATYTGNMKDAFKAAGFEVLTDKKYLTGPDYLLPGDILLNEQHHTATNVTIGKYAMDSAQTQTTTIPSSIQQAQAQLNTLIGAGLTVDGQVGSKTMAAFRKAMQYALNKDYGTGLVVDGEIGSKSQAALAKCNLKSGSKGYMVTILEIGLTLKGYDPKGIEIPGVFGAGLKAAVGKFQADKGLAVDYVAGKNTLLELQK